MTIVDMPRSADAPLRDAGDRLAAMEARLRQLAQDVDEIKRELRRAQNERLEDMTLVVDLLTTTWQAVDRRLSRIDRQLDRLEGSPGRSRRPRLP